MARASKEPYKDREWLYHHYVHKRMNMTDICKLLEKNYSITITPQAVYNWCKKFDLLKYRGKGRNLSRTSMRGRTGTGGRPMSPQKKREEQMRKRYKRGK